MSPYVLACGIQKAIIDRCDHLVEIDMLVERSGMPSFHKATYRNRRPNIRRQASVIAKIAFGNDWAHIKGFTISNRPKIDETFYYEDPEFLEQICDQLKNLVDEFEVYRSQSSLSMRSHDLIKNAADEYNP